MITPEYTRAMAAYNRWQNRSLYREADALSDAERKEQRGAFFGSIHGTSSAHVAERYIPFEPLPTIWTRPVIARSAIAV